MKDNPIKIEFYSIDGEAVSLCLLETVEGNKHELPFYWWSIVENKARMSIEKIRLRLGRNYHSYRSGNVGYEIDKGHRGHHYAASALILLHPIAKVVAWNIFSLLVVRTTSLHIEPSNAASATF